MSVVEPALRGHPRYVLLERLGVGGGGVVYRARDRARTADVALKVMRSRPGRDMRALAQVFAALVKIEHPNLVRLYDFAEHHGQWFLTMELVEGYELLDYVREDGRLNELRVRKSLSQIASGLRTLHHEQRVHRDVKTHNIRVTAEGRAVLLDMDLSKSLTEESSPEHDGAGRPEGTALYMAPEQASAARVTPASDWYGLGVVLFECLTGSLPFDGGELDVMLAKQHAQAPRASSRVSGLPGELDDLCADLLSVESDVRPSGAEVMRRLGVHEDVVSGSLSLVSLLSDHPSMLARGAELDSLQRELLLSRDGLRVVRVSGGDGVGKTTLCREFLQRASQSEGAPLTHLSSCPRFPDQPHAPVHGLVRRLVEALLAGAGATQVPLSGSGLRLLERAFPGMVAGLRPRTEGRGAEVPDPLEQRWRALEALRVLLCEVASQRPLVWCVDNEHWSDADTQLLLASLVQSADPPKMLLVLAGAYEPTGTTRGQIEFDVELCLAPFDTHDARAYVDAMFERATGRVEQSCEELWNRGGTPALLDERVRHALFFQQSPSPELALEELIERRIRTLAPGALRLLCLLCCAFDPVALETAERASALSRQEFSRQLSALRVAGLVRSDSLLREDAIAPAHSAVVDAVEAGMSPATRADLHARLAVAMVARDLTRASGRLLRHQGEAAQHLEAADSARVAAEQAHAGLAFQRAAELFTLAASLDPPLAGQRGHRSLRRMGDALAHAGWALQAATMYREAANGASAADALSMRYHAAEYLIRGAELSEGMEALRELLASIGLSLPSSPGRSGVSVWAHRLWLSVRGLHFSELDEGHVSERDLRRIDVMWSAGLQLGLVDLMRGGDFISRGLLLALQTGEPTRVARALCTEAWMTPGVDTRGLRRTEAVLSTARELIDRLDSPYLHGQLQLAEGLVAFAEFRLPDCLRQCRDAERVLRDHCTGVVWETHAAQNYQLISLAFMGRFRTLRPMLSTCLREAHERGDLWGYSNVLGVAAFVRAVADARPDVARAEAEEAMARWRGGAHNFHLQHMFGVLAIAHAELQRGADALHVVEPLWQSLGAKGFLRARFARTALFELRARARVARATGTGNQADDLVLALQDASMLTSFGDVVSAGLAELIRANVCAVQGRREAALPRLEAAIECLSEQDLDLWVPAARYARGALLGGDEGRRLRATAESLLAERGVRDPLRFIGMLMPGFAGEL